MPRIAVRTVTSRVRASAVGDLPSSWRSHCSVLCCSRPWGRRSGRRGATAPHGHRVRQPVLRDAAFPAVRAHGAHDVAQLNRPLGQRAADRLAVRLGLSRADVFTPAQYAAFVTGKGVGGDLAQAKLVDASVAILTNTVGRPLTRGSTGTSRRRCRRLRAVRQHRRHAREPRQRRVPGPEGQHGHRARRLPRHVVPRQRGDAVAGGPLPLGVPGRDGVRLPGAAAVECGAAGHQHQARDLRQVGNADGAALWITRFGPIYTPYPKLAADIPARWAPIPTTVATAMLASPDGRVPYADYASLLQ